MSDFVISAGFDASDHERGVKQMQRSLERSLERQYGLLEHQSRRVTRRILADQAKIAKSGIQGSAMTPAMLRAYAAAEQRASASLIGGSGLRAIGGRPQRRSMIGRIGGRIGGAYAGVGLAGAAGAAAPLLGVGAVLGGGIVAASRYGERNAAVRDRLDDVGSEFGRLIDAVGNFSAGVIAKVDDAYGITGRIRSARRSLMGMDNAIGRELRARDAFTRTDAFYARDRAFREAQAPLLERIAELVGGPGGASARDAANLRRQRLQTVAALGAEGKLDNTQQLQLQALIRRVEIAEENARDMERGIRRLQSRAQGYGDRAAVMGIGPQTFDSIRTARGYQMTAERMQAEAAAMAIQDPAERSAQLARVRGHYRTLHDAERREQHRAAGAAAMTLAQERRLERLGLLESVGGQLGGADGRAMVTQARLAALRIGTDRAVAGIDRQTLTADQVIEAERQIRDNARIRAMLIERDTEQQFAASAEDTAFRINNSPARAAALAGGAGQSVSLRRQAFGGNARTQQEIKGQLNETNRLLKQIADEIGGSLGLGN